MQPSPRDADAPPLVSVVIPTADRPQLVARAARSALAQDVEEIEVVVVVDGPDDATLQALGRIDDVRLRVRVLPQRSGVAGARNAGVGAARSPWVALLDDDDEWLPGKLKLQLEAARRSRYRHPIVSCRFIARGSHGDQVLPRRLPGPDEVLCEYLFCQSGLLGGEGVVLPSTILTTRDVLQQVPFRYRCLPHEGSDWLLRALHHGDSGVEFVAAEAPLVVWHAGETRGRMSNTADWETSRAWAADNRDLLTPRAHASFLLIRASLEARRGRHWSAFWELLRNAFQRGRPTPIAIMAHASIWLVPERARFTIAALLTAWLPHRARDASGGASRGRRAWRRLAG